MRGGARQRGKSGAYARAPVIRRRQALLFRGRGSSGETSRKRKIRARATGRKKQGAGGCGAHTRVRCAPGPRWREWRSRGDQADEETRRVSREEAAYVRLICAWGSSGDRDGTTGRGAGGLQGASLCEAMAF